IVLVLGAALPGGLAQVGVVAAGRDRAPAGRLVVEVGHEPVSLEHLVAQQLTTALDVVRMPRVPAQPVALALAASGLPPRAEDRLDVVEERLADRPHADRHRPRFAHPVAATGRAGTNSILGRVEADQPGDARTGSGRRTRG